MNHRQHLQLSAAKRTTMNLVGNPVWRAFASQPMVAAQQRDLSLDAHSAFDEIVHGRGAGCHVDVLATAANTCLVLCERGFGPECEPKIIEGQHALMRLKARLLQGKRIGFDGPGAQAMRDMLDVHAQQLEHAGQGEVAAAIVEVYKRAALGNTCRIEATP